MPEPSTPDLRPDALVQKLLQFDAADEISQGLEAVAMVNLHLGDYHQGQEQFSQSVVYYETALESYFGLITDDTPPERLLERCQIIKDIKIKIVQSLLAEGEHCIQNQSWETGLNAFKQALVYQPQNNLLFHHIGHCFLELKQWDSACFFLNQSLALNPQYDESYRLLGDIYAFHAFDSEKAIANYTHYCDLKPNNAGVWNMLCHLYNPTNLEKSIACGQKAIAIQPNFMTAVKNVLFGLIKSPHYSQKELYELTVKHITDCLYHLGFKDEAKYQYACPPSPKEKLHIAYISGDFLNHPVLMFILPILKNHNPEKFTVSLFSSSKTTDRYTEQCKSLAAHFHDISHLNDQEAAHLIHEQEIDILVDLGGHTGSSRVAVMAYKPAPIQISYIGYNNTTGIAAVDYFFTHRDLSHPEDQPYFAEKLYPISPYYCFESFDWHNPPDIASLPALENGYITFGSFNQINKINDGVLQLWSRVMAAVPDAKLLICRSALIPETMRERCQQAGISPERVILDTTYTLEKHHLVDIQLDTLPFNAVTTAFHSLEMGVPVLSLSGEHFQSRQGSYINRALGLADFTAQTPAEFVAKAVFWSQNLARLADIRSGLRNRLNASAFKDFKGMTATLEKAYQDMWQTYVNLFEITHQTSDLAAL